MMDFTAEEPCKESPQLKSNIFGKLTFWWINDVFWFRKTRHVTVSDIYNVLPEYRSDILSKKLEISWEREIKEAKLKNVPPNFWKALISTFIRPFLIILPMPTLYSILTVLQPLIVKPLIAYFHVGSTISVIQAWILTALIVALMIIQILLHRHAYHMLMLLGVKIRIACSSLIFKKITRLSNASMRNCTEGSIINLISTDAMKFEYFVGPFGYTLISPLQTIVAIYIMWQINGVTAIAAILILNVQCLPISIFLYNVAKKIRIKLVVKQDKRISLISEMINGIRTLKMYVWERYFEKMAFLTRSREINVQMKVSLIQCFIQITILFAYRSSTFLTILICTLTNSDKLSAENVVTIVQILNILMLTVNVHTMQSANIAADVNISVKRIQNFLCLEEVHHYVKYLDSQPEETSISIKNVSASWNKDSLALQNISLKINSNKLCCITGLVGSGKSTLLKLILDEFPPTSGDVHVRGKVSYASQEPWLFPATIRDNILLGQEYDKEKYEKVIEACDLAEDLNILPYRDMTLVGERGMVLSGGQCARVNLARAVYRDAEIYLLDDPLAAVDVHVNKRIFQNCIKNYLKNKTRVLVTHNIDHLQDTDEIILMKKGTIEFHDSPDKFNEFIENLSYQANVDEGKTLAVNNNISSQIQSIVTAKVREKSKKSNSQEEEELTAQGFIAKSIYWDYIRSTDSFLLIFLLVIGFLTSCTMFTIFDYAVISRTREIEFVFKDFNNHTLERDLDYYQSANYPYGEKWLYFCGFLLLTALVLLVLSCYLYFFLFLKANKNIHNKMLECVIRAPMKFFQKNTTGRILNRFSKDTMTADDVFLKSAVCFICHFIILFTSFIAITIIYWWSIFPLLLVFLFLIFMTKVYILTTLGFSRLEGNAKSPVLSLSSSSIAGLLTIRCFRAEEIFSKVFDIRQNRHTSIVHLNACIGVTHGLYSQLSVAAFFAIVVCGTIALKGHIRASDIGYVLANIVLLLQTLQFVMRIFSDAVTQSISVERMIQYTKLDREKSDDGKIEKTTLKSWPSMGELRFNRVYFRYSEDSEPVLKNFTFTVEPGSKVGIVGRTGAGKSSLIAALFRLAEIEGSILIDGIDTKSINLFDLRSRISIIPQEPFLFSASLRSNLDPLNEFDDASIWSALRDVELNQTFTTLEHPIEKAGSNLSLGERQLICLARAVIRRNKILVLDEATANIDSTTDALIQKTIRTKFKGCTILIVAHRLNTILDSDKILVIHEGEMVEFDRPDVLLQKKDGYFAAMVQTLDNDTALA